MIVTQIVIVALLLQQERVEGKSDHKRLDQIKELVVHDTLGSQIVQQRVWDE